MLRRPSQAMYGAEASHQRRSWDSDNRAFICSYMSVAAVQNSHRRRAKALKEDIGLSLMTVCSTQQHSVAFCRRAQ